MITCTIQDRKYQEMLEGVYDALIGRGRLGDAANLIRQESGLAAKQFVNLTPPPGNGEAAMKQGNAAVARDINKVFTGIEPEFFDTVGSEHGVANVDFWFTKPGGDKVHVDWRRLVPDPNDIPAIHRRHQDRRGRTRYMKKPKDQDDWFAAYAVRKDDLLAYIKKIIGHVGRRKSAWAKWALQMGQRVPRWVKRHVEDGSAPGAHVDLSHTTNHPSITLTSHAPGVTGDEHIIRSVMKVRARALKRRAKLIISGYAKDVKAGMRPRRKVLKEFMEIE